MSCVRCGRDVQPAFRYCPWCGAVQRRKRVEFFHGHLAIDRRRALRVTRYLPTRDQEPHVRVSVWDERGEAQAAVSIDEGEAARLSAFLRPRSRPSRLRDVVGHFSPRRTGGACADKHRVVR